MFTAGLLTTTSTRKQRRCPLTDVSIEKQWKVYAMEYCSCYFVAKLYLTLLRPQGLQLTRILCPWDFPCKNTGVCCHFLLLGIFLTQRLNPWLLHWEADFLPLTHQDNPVEYFSVIKMNKIVSLLERWINLSSVIQRRKSEREKQRLNINVYVWDREEWHR